MANGLDELRGLGEETLDYVKLRWASVRLGVAERLSTAVSRVLGRIVALVVVLFAVLFLMVALALWIGEMLGHLSLGFLVAGGTLLLAGIILFYVGRRFFADSTVRWFVDLLFTDNDYKDGTRE